MNIGDIVIVTEFEEIELTTPEDEQEQIPQEEEVEIRV